MGIEKVAFEKVTRPDNVFCLAAAKPQLIELRLLPACLQILMQRFLLAILATAIPVGVQLVQGAAAAGASQP